MFGRNGGCDDILWIIILFFILCNCCGNDDRRGMSCCN